MTKHQCSNADSVSDKLKIEGLTPSPSQNYYYEDGKVIFTEKFLLDRGYCCGLICRHCPYGEEIQKAASGKR